jgi:hypothetical protein
VRRAFHRCRIHTGGVSDQENLYSTSMLLCTFRSPHPCWLFDTVKKRWLMVKVTDILRKRGKSHRRVAAADGAKSVEFMRQVSRQTSAHDLMRHNDSPVNLGAPRDKPGADWSCDQWKVYRQLPVDLAKLHPPPPLDGVPRGYSQPANISELDACKVFRREDNMWYDGTIVHTDGATRFAPSTAALSGSS